MKKIAVAIPLMACVLLLAADPDVPQREIVFCKETPYRHRVSVTRVVAYDALATAIERARTSGSTPPDTAAAYIVTDVAEDGKVQERGQFLGYTWHMETEDRAPQILDATVVEDFAFVLVRTHGGVVLHRFGQPEQASSPLAQESDAMGRRYAAGWIRGTTLAGMVIELQNVGKPNDPLLRFDYQSLSRQMGGEQKKGELGYPLDSTRPNP